MKDGLGYDLPVAEKLTNPMNNLRKIHLKGRQNPSTAIANPNLSPFPTRGRRTGIASCADPGECSTRPRPHCPSPRPSPNPNRNSQAISATLIPPHSGHFWSIDTCAVRQTIKTLPPFSPNSGQIQAKRA